MGSGGAKGGGGGCDGGGKDGGGNGATLPFALPDAFDSFNSFKCSLMACKLVSRLHCNSERKCVNRSWSMTTT